MNKDNIFENSGKITMCSTYMSMFINIVDIILKKHKIKDSELGMLLTGALCSLDNFNCTMYNLGYIDKSFIDNHTNNIRVALQYSKALRDGFISINDMKYINPKELLYWADSVNDIAMCLELKTELDLDSFNHYEKLFNRLKLMFGI